MTLNEAKIAKEKANDFAFVKNQMEKISQQTDSPQVIAPPPLIYLSGLVVGIVLHWFEPVTFLPDKLALPLGATLVAVSVVLVIVAMRTFVRAGTNIDVRKPTTNIVKTGPYRFTRNPIYLSMTLFVLGITAWLNSLWILITLVPVLFVIGFGVIKREEAYLVKKFGEEYVLYKSKVRRWI